MEREILLNQVAIMEMLLMFAGNVDMREFLHDRLKRTRQVLKEGTSAITRPKNDG